MALILVRFSMCAVSNPSYLIVSSRKSLVKKLMKKRMKKRRATDDSPCPEAWAASFLLFVVVLVKWVVPFCRLSVYLFVCEPATVPYKMEYFFKNSKE
mmetsp:Transcript_8229/g.19858  ORF Transcript_8229/g.19858 Transcript_8229/m.19858 type:complete len:98 (+) Transcript_8229:2156-2449(+)